MVVTISAIFVISYGAGAILHLLNNQVGSFKLGPYVFPIAHTVFMFNSAVNPYAYALINQRFRKRMKRMICCSVTFSANRLVPVREQQDNEMANNVGTKSSNIAETTSKE